MTTATMALSPGQQQALEKISQWFADPFGEQVFRMFGPAGTGKTTIARNVPEMTGAPLHYFAAFSGKAVNVLRTKGCNPAQTLHSLIYGGPTNLKAELKKLKAQWEQQEPPVTDEEKAQDTTLREQIKALEEKIRAEGNLRFGLNPDSVLYDVCNRGGLVIADEVSMVGDRMVDDLLRFGCRFLVLGDPFQLPPVRGEGALTKAAPDVMLDEIHRQGLDSPVLSLATAIRLGERPNVRRKAPLLKPWYEYDQVLTWRRATRWNAVRAIRSRAGSPPEMPVPGDRVMCLANNSALGIFNGQSWLVHDVKPGEEDGTVTLHLIDESDDVTDPEYVEQYPAYLAGFDESTERAAEEKGIGRGDDDTGLFTFAQALTVHKSQGSEWRNVLVMDETPSMFHMEERRRGSLAAREQVDRWMYTAVTRASNSVAVVPPKSER